MEKLKQLFMKLTSNSDNERDKLFPVYMLAHLGIIYLAIVIGYAIYKDILIEAHDDFSAAIMNTQVVPDFLKNYSASARSGSNGKPNDGTLFEKTLSHRELAEIFLAANIVEKRDVSDPNAILDIKNGGVGPWLATTMLDTRFQSDNMNLVEAMAGVKRTLANGERVEVPTLEVLVRLYRETGFGGDAVEDESTYYNDYLKLFAEELSGITAELCPIDDYCGFLNTITFTEDPNNSKKDIDIAAVIKSAMKSPFKHYDPLLANEEKILKQYEYDPSDPDTQDYVKMEGEPEQKLLSQNWFKQEPGKLSDSVFKLSYLLTTELYRHDNVKSSRFKYQAFRGSIQLALFILISYLALMLIWRLIQVLMGLQASEHWLKRPFIPLPILFRGSINQTNYEMELIRSRGAIDQLINVLPLIGLFGTVWGISGALPNAAAAVSGGGPGATQNVNALFEQLGLAFITTAIAVAGVIILEYCWEKIQAFEEKMIWHKVHNS